MLRPFPLVFTAAVTVLITAAVARGDDAAAAGSVSPAPAHPATAPAGAFQSQVVPLLEQFCYECHGDGASSGDLEMDAFKTIDDVRRDKKRWEKVIQYARTQTMPPLKADQPTQEQRDALVEALHRELHQIDPSNPDPGRITIRRLNRAEYRNTVRDLIGVSFDPTIDFPQDDTGYGFDNIGDVLTLPPMLMEKYLAAAERILDEAVPTERTEHRQRIVSATEARANFQRSERAAPEGWVALSSVREDSLSVSGESVAPAEFVVRVLAYGKYHEEPPPGKAAQEPLRLSIMRGDAVVRDIAVTADEGKPQWHEARVGVPAGRHEIRIAMRRERGIAADTVASSGHVGKEQAGLLFIKEILIDGPVTGALRRVDGDLVEITGTAVRQGRGVVLTRTDDTAAATIDLPADGNYVLRAQACAEYAGGEPAKMELLLDGKPLARFDVDAPAALKADPPGAGKLPDPARRPVPQVYEVRTDLPSGKRRLAARFVNNHREPEHADPNYRDRNLHIQHFEVVELSAPPLSPPMTGPMRRLFATHAPKPVPGEAPGSTEAGTREAQSLLSEFTRRAWRRPPQPDELDRVMKLYQVARDNGEGFQGSVKHAMKGVLVSSSFLFRGEPAPRVEPAQRADAAAQPIGEYELASRLSYFLWSSMPDDELLTLAERGELRKNVDAQVTRLLASSKSEAFIDNFAGQWLQFRNLDAVHPDRKMFKAYNDRLRDAMQRETELFFGHIMREDRSLLDVLTGDYTFVNERLATHYGLSGVKGEEFKRVSLAGTPRRGVLTHGSVLTLTSNPTRTSPVKRGKWVLENLLGTPPPPPPPNVPPLETDGKPLTGPLRQRLEQHRANKSCASCHAALDPMGFALENFDAVGAWRDAEGSNPVDASATMANGAKFTGPRELAELLATARRKDFYRSITEAALTFALGRGVEPFDQPAVDRIVRDLQQNDGKFSALIFGVVNSVPFQMRRAGADAEAAPPPAADAAQARFDGIRGGSSQAP